MGLTGKERQWLQLCLQSHQLFCDCTDPEDHLTRCLTMHTEEEEAQLIEAAMDTIITDTSGEPGDRDTGAGTAGEHTTAG
ncbi:ORF2 [torque teno Delphinidae virus 31]